MVSSLSPDRRRSCKCPGVSVTSAGTLVRATGTTTASTAVTATTAARTGSDYTTVAVCYRGNSDRVHALSLEINLRRIKDDFRPDPVTRFRRTDDLLDC